MIFQSLILGFEFQKDGKAIGNVSLLNKGTVRIVDNVSEQEKLILASVSSALIARTNLESIYME